MALKSMFVCTQYTCKLFSLIDFSLSLYGNMRATHVRPPFFPRRLGSTAIIQTVPGALSTLRIRVCT